MPKLFPLLYFWGESPHVSPMCYLTNLYALHKKNFLQKKVLEHGRLFLLCTSISIILHTIDCHLQNIFSMCTDLSETSTWTFKAGTYRILAVMALSLAVLFHSDMMSSVGLTDITAPHISLPTMNCSPSIASSCSSGGITLRTSVVYH